MPVHSLILDSDECYEGGMTLEKNRSPLLDQTIYLFSFSCIATVLSMATTSGFNNFIPFIKFYMEFHIYNSIFFNFS